MVKLSITIAYYNTYELTVKLLEKLIPQLTDEVEVFLVDDGCNETRLDVYEDKINIIHLKENGGGAHADNVGLKKSKGKYLTVIDSDDLITDDYINTLLLAINEHGEDVIVFDWQDLTTGEVVHKPNNYAPWKAIYKKEIIPLFHDGWIYSYDVPFQEELTKKNPSYAYLDKVLYLYNSGRLDNLTHLKAETIKRGE